MITTLKRGASKKSIAELLKIIYKKMVLKGVDAHSFCGKISLKKDALSIQKELRNEWN